MDPLVGAVLIVLIALAFTLILSGMGMRHYRLREMRKHQEQLELQARKRDAALDENEALGFKAEIEKAKTRRAEIALEAKRLEADT